MAIEFCILTIENLQTGINSEWTFKETYRGYVYDEIRKAMHQGRDLTIILDTDILLIPSALVSVSVLKVHDLPPIYPPSHVSLKITE